MADQSRDEIYTNTRRILELLGISQAQAPSSSMSTARRGGGVKKRKNNLISENDVIQEYAGAAEEEDEPDPDEVNRYLTTTLSMSNSDTLLGWWNKHSLLFPQLALLARSLFGVPASSATAERVFSSTGLILNKGRQSLNPDIVDDILMIRNFRSI